MLLHICIIAVVVLGYSLPACAAPSSVKQQDAWGQLDKLIKPGQDLAARQAAIIKAVRSSAVVPATVTVDASIEENNVASIDVGTSSADLDCKLRSLKIAKNVFQSDIGIGQINVNWQAAGSGKSIHLQRSDVARIDKGEDPMRIATSLEAKPMAIDSPKISGDSKSFADRIALAREARKKSDFDGAIREYEAALAIKDDPNAHIALGDLYRVRNVNDKAITEYKSAAGAADSAELQVKLAMAYQAKKDLPSALGAYKRAVQLKPNDSDMLDALKSGWEEALKDEPTSPANHVGLGNAHQLAGDFAEAEAEYRQALMLDRNYEPAKEALAKLRDARQQHQVNPPREGTPDSSKRATSSEAVAKGVDFGPYVMDLQRRLKRAWFPPKGRESERVDLYFKIHRDGMSSDLRVEHSSGVEIADKAALRAADNAAPFRPLPAGSPDEVEVVAIMNDGEVEADIHGVNVEGTAGGERKPLKGLIEKTVKGTDLSGYFDNVTGQIKQSWHPDDSPADPVAIEFTILKNGKIQDVSINEGSGSSSFDNSARQAVQSIDQLDRLPHEIKEKLRTWAVFESGTKEVFVGSPREVDFAPYMTKLQKRIKRAWFPPRGHESRLVVIIFKVDKQGQSSDLRLSKSSGVVIADQAATQAIKNASPMPRLPRGSPSKVDIEFKFDYKGDKGVPHKGSIIRF